MSDPERSLATPSRIAAEKRNRLALAHVKWLSDEKRHTTMQDEDAAHAVRCGWCEPIPGIMGHGWFRLSLTEQGAMALSNG